MPSYSKGEIVLVRYPFSDLSGSKVRPAIIVSPRHTSQDLFVIPLTSHTARLLTGEFVLGEWKTSGLNVASAVKRSLFTIHESLIVNPSALSLNPMLVGLKILCEAGWVYES